MIAFHFQMDAQRPTMSMQWSNLCDHSSTSCKFYFWSLMLTNSRRSGGRGYGLEEDDDYWHWGKEMRIML